MDILKLKYKYENSDTRITVIEILSNVLMIIVSSKFLKNKKYFKYLKIFVLFKIGRTILKMSSYFHYNI